MRLRFRAEQKGYPFRGGMFLLLDQGIRWLVVSLVVVVSVVVLLFMFLLVVVSVESVVGAVVGRGVLQLSRVMARPTTKRTFFMMQVCR